MKDQAKTKQVLIQELVSLRQRIAELEQSKPECKKEKEGLKKIEARFRSYFDLPLHGIAITSPEKGWIEVNDRLCSIMGYSREEIVRITWSEITHPDDLTADVEQFNRVLSGQIEQYTMDKRFIRKDGKVIWTSIAVGCVRESDGRVDYIVGVMEDITERKRMEEEKHHLEERSRKVVEDIFRFIPEGVLVFSRKMELLRQNQAFRDLVTEYARRLGFAEDELENLIIDKVKAGLRNNNIKEIKIARKHEPGKET